MSKTLLYLLVLAVLLMAGTVTYVSSARRSEVPVTVPSPSAATPVPVSPSPAAASTAPIADPYAGWKTYSSAEFGFTFRYPSEWGDVSLSSVLGDSGKYLGGRFSDRPSLAFGGQTVDFTRGIGASFLNFAGCVEEDGGAYGCRFAAGDKIRKVTPSKTFRTSDGNAGLLLFDTEIPLVLSSGDRGAYVNLSGPTYLGVSFLDSSATSAGAAAFDRMVESVASLR